MINKLKKISERQFVRNVVTMMSGTTIAQVITILSTPILTRLFTPDDFGILAIVTSISAIIAILYTLQYDMSIVLAKKDTIAKQILGMSINLSILTFFLTLILGVASLYVPILNMIGYEDVPSYIILIGLFVGLLLAYEKVLKHWNTRKKYFKTITIAVVTASVVSAIFRISFGYLFGGAIILIIGALLTHIIIIIIQVIYGKNGRVLADGVRLSYDWNTTRNLLYEYRDFPKFRLPQVLLNTFGQNIPNLLLVSFFSPAIVGFYTLANRMVKMPGSLVNNSIRSVFFQKSAELYNKKNGLFQALRKTTTWLAIGGIIPFTIIAILSPIIFPIIFGEEWAVAGNYASIMAIWMFTVFCNTPSAATIPVLRQQKRYLIFNIGGLIVRMLALTMGALTGGPFEAILYYVIIAVIYNILIIVDVHLQAYRYENN